MQLASLQAFVEELVKTTEINAIPPVINVVFDSGAFNGGFGAGTALYINALTKQQPHIKLGQVSGCSAGAFVAVWLLSGCPLASLRHVDDMYNHYRQHLNMANYKKIVKKFVNELFANDRQVKIKLNGRIFINYYDTVLHEQCVIHKFRGRRHLTRCIVRSSHIPFVTNGQPCNNGRYIDGMVPYIIPYTKEATIFVRLVTLSKLKRVFSINAEPNAHFRLLAGIADAHEFFLTGSSDMCDYINNWSCFHYAHIKLRLITCLVCFKVLVLLQLFIKAWQWPDVICRYLKEFKGGLRRLAKQTLT
jgi:hypothetical protein